MQIKFCIECGEDVVVEDGIEGHTTIQWMAYDDGSAEINFCEGPFASVQPPVNFEDDWDLQVVEPSQEKLAEMNLNAEVLYQDFEYEGMKF